MMRNTAGFKQIALLGLVSAALASGACSDDDDAVFGDAGSGGMAGSSGSSTGGKSSGGKSGGGSSTGGKSSGTSGTDPGEEGGMPATAGTAGTSSTAGTSTTGGTAGNGGEPATTGGEGGGATDAEGGGSMGGEGGAAPSGEGGAGGGGQTIVYDTLENPGFESGSNHSVPTGWTNEGTSGAAYYEYDQYAHGGTGKLSHWTDYNPAPQPAYTARTFQTLDPIENGTYSFSIWVNRDWADEQYLFATGYDVSAPAAEKHEPTVDGSGFVKITLSGIVVTSGRCTVGVYSANGAGTWANFDDAEFVKTE